MDFLKALEKAQELGLTKEEFLPIYLQEMEEKTTNLLHFNSELGIDPQSIEATEPDSGELSEPYSFQQWQDRKPQNQDIQKESLQLFTKNDVQDLKSSINNLKELLFSQFLNFACDTATQNDRFFSMQQDIQKFLKQIHSNIQTILPNQQNCFPEQSGLGKLEVLNAELLQKLEDHGLKLRSEIHDAQDKIIAGISCQNCSKEDTNLAQTQKHEELSRLQNLENNYHKLQFIVQQGQSDLSAMISNMTPFVMEGFKKICEFQNTACAELQLQKTNQQILMTNAANTCSGMAINTNLLNLLNGGIASVQNQSQVQHFKIVDSLTKFEGMLLGMKVAVQPSKNTELDEINLPPQLFINEELNNKSPEDSKHHSLSCSQFLCNNLHAPFVCGTDSNGGFVSFNCCFHVSNISPFLKSRNEFHRVKYDKKLGCCLRAGFYFPDEGEKEDVLAITLEMCQVDSDMRLPNLLRISTEISLVCSFDVYSKWIVARENGVFNLPRIKEKGWFEICAAFLDFKSPEFAKFTKNGDILFNYHIVVLHNLENDINRNTDIYFELSNHQSSSSKSKCSEYFEVTFEELEETDNQKMSSEVRTMESVSQPLSHERIEEHKTIFISHSSYYLPICELSTLISSETLIDSQDWYLQFLGHSVHAVLVFLDDDTLMICIDYYHGKLCESLPEFAVFRCRVTMLDQTDEMKDSVIGEKVEMFDLTGASLPDWMENCICTIHCNAIEDRFKNNDTILLKFDFFEIE